MVARLACVVLAAAVATCSMLQSGERPPLGVSNGTDLVIIVIVNGMEAGRFAPGVGADIDVNLLPPLPWTVEARTTTGRLLTSMDVQPGQVFRKQLPDGSTQTSGALGRVDLSCGRFDMWAGEPIGGPAPGPGKPGDCVP
jgi:hypothetical protein